jgi:hypothetical protein
MKRQDYLERYSKCLPQLKLQVQGKAVGDQSYLVLPSHALSQQ